MSDPRRWRDPGSDAGDHARDLLQRAPTVPPMSAEAKARIAAKLAAASAVPAAAAGLSRWKLLFGAGVIGLATAGMFWRFGDRHANNATAVPARAPVGSATSDETPQHVEPREATPAVPLAAETPPAAAPSTAIETSTPPASTRSAGNAHGPRAAIRDDTPRAAHANAADELEIVQRASALADRDPRAALTATHEHESHFPHGDYVEERESIAVRALANAGQTRAARDRAERFLRQYPASIYATRVRGILDTLR